MARTSPISSSAKRCTPYPEHLMLVTKIGARRGADGSWNRAFSAADLTGAVHDNLRNLGLDELDVVNLRLMFGIHGPAEGSIEAPLAALAKLQRQGLVRHIGLSNVTPKQIEESRAIADIVCVQNHYNLVHRGDDALIDRLAAEGIAYVPFFPLGGFAPLQSTALSEVARGLGVTPDAGRPGMAAAARTQYLADSRHLDGCAFARKPRGGDFAAAEPYGECAEPALDIARAGMKPNGALEKVRMTGPALGATFRW